MHAFGAAVGAGESPFREEDVAPVVQQLEARGLLDDSDFAAWYREQRQRFRPRSKRLLRSEMTAKGVEGATIADQLDMYDERDACRRLAQRKARYPEDKLVAYLVRNGFAYGMARSVLREERGEGEDPW